MRRAVRQVVAVIVLAFAALTVAGGSAQAADDGDTGNPIQRLLGVLPKADVCLKPPVPAAPTSGVSGWLDGGPKRPATGDPFTKAPRQVNNIGQPVPRPSIYDVYGYGGLTVVAFDDGCASVNVWNAITNINVGMAKTQVALSVTMYRAVLEFPLWTVFEPFQTAAAKVLGKNLFIPFVGVVLMGTSLYLLILYRKAAVSATVGVVGGTMLVLMVGFIATMYPVTVGKSVNDGMSGAIGAASASYNDGKPPADSLGGTLHESLLWSNWQQETFGQGVVNAKAAAEYGPALFKAGAFTRAEQAKIDKDPKVASSMIAAKQDAYKKVAKEIKDKYPQVYQYIAGNQSLEQFGFSFAGNLAVVIATAFLLFSLGKILYAMAIVPLGGGFVPLVAFFAAFPPYQRNLFSLLGLMWDAVMKALVYGVAAVLFLRLGIGRILSPDTVLHPIWKMLFLLAMTVAAWAVAKKMGVADDIAKLRKVGRFVSRQHGKLRPDEGFYGDRDDRDRVDEDATQDARHGDRDDSAPEPAPAAPSLPRAGSSGYWSSGDSGDATHGGDAPEPGNAAPREVPVYNVRDSYQPRHAPVGEIAAAPAEVKTPSIKGGAAKGAAVNTAVVGGATVATGGAATVPLVAGAAAKGAAKGGGAAAVAKRGQGKVQDSRIYHPSQTGNAPDQLSPSRMEGKVRVHDVYRPERKVAR